MTPMMNDIPFIILNDKTIISFKNYRSFFFERYYGVIEEFDNYNMVKGTKTGSRLSICRLFVLKL